MSGLTQFEAAVEQRWNSAALSAQADGKPIVGYLDAGFPEEVAIAAGMVPILLTGDPHGTFAATDGHVDAGIPGRARQLYEGFLTGRYDFADAVVITGGDRYLANTYGFLQGYRQAAGQGPSAELFYLERARGTYRQHRDFNRDRIGILRSALSRYAGTSVDDEALQKAIGVVNTTRALLERLTLLRIARPGTVSGPDAATIALASRLMPKERFNAALARFLDSVPDESAAASGKPKVFLTGSPLDHTALHQAVETAGGVVVGEDIDLAGTQDFLQVREDLDPLEGIADRYTFRFPERWRFGRDRRITANVETARSSGADAVLFFHALYDSAAGWDFPDLRAGLQAHGIPVLAVQDQPYQLAGGTLQDQVAAAVGSMPLKEPAAPA